MHAQTHTHVLMKADCIDGIDVLRRGVTMALEREIFLALILVQMLRVRSSGCTRTPQFQGYCVRAYMRVCYRDVCVCDLLHRET
jgi:hypothetical protein